MVEAIVNISTFRGSCVEATHYYGSLHVISSEFIELKRPITQEEIDKNPDRWYNYDEGDLTNCFKSWRDVIIAAGKKAKEIGLDLDTIAVVGIPNTERLSYRDSLKPLDTRPKCKRCGKVFKPGEPCYNTPSGLFCVTCYETRNDTQNRKTGICHRS